MVHFMCWRRTKLSAKKDTKYFSLCCWNLNSLDAHDFAKVSVLKPLDATGNFDFIMFVGVIPRLCNYHCQTVTN